MESRRLRSVLQRDLAQAHANLAEYRKTAARLECALARIARGSCIHCEADEVAVAALS